MSNRTQDEQNILNAVYSGAVKECEEREHNGGLTGNGHHMAQKITKLVEEELVRKGIFKNPPEGPRAA